MTPEQQAKLAEIARRQRALASYRLLESATQFNFVELHPQ